MNPRERYLEALLFGQPDRVPLTPGGPRESTLAAWHAQGLPQDMHYVDALSELLSLPREAFETIDAVPVSFRMIPTYEEKVLQHEKGHYIVQDWMGAITEISDEFDYTYIRAAKDFVTRKWHRFPVQSRADWEGMAWRYNAADPVRYPPDWAGSIIGVRTRLASSPRAVVVSVNGPFWQMREWVGMENLCLLMLDDPEFVDEMAGFWRRFTLELLEDILRQVRVDVLQVSEDMAYKAHSMISPAMVRRFLLPTYQAWHELLRAHDCPIMDMDSDGDVGVLLPLWVEAGINVCDPVEVAAGNDIVAYRKRYGRQMAYRGGIDKRALAAGGQTMLDELERVVTPLLHTAPADLLGGFVPSCDHGVPPDVSWPHFVDYTRRLAELTGWL